MKREGSALALAIVLQGVSCAAQAQSSVTLYGVVDAVLDFSNQGNGLLARESSGGTLGSRWGIQGSEDLGGGYKTVFTFENGFGINNGAAQQGGLLFGRQAWVGFQGPAGVLSFGRQYSPEFWAFTNNDAFALGMAGGLSNISRTLPNGTVVGLLNAYVTTGRTNNAVVYTSPTIQGLTVRVLYAFGGIAGSLSDGSTISVGANYANGPITLNAGYVKNKDANGTGELIAWSAGGSVTFGPAHIYAAYTKDTDTTANTLTTAGPKAQFALANLGVLYQLNSAIQLIAQVTHITNTSDGLAASQNAYVESVGVVYSLSKRTSLYSGYGQVQNRHGSTYSLGGGLYLGGPAAPGATGRTFQLGMRTLF